MITVTDSFNRVSRDFFGAVDFVPLPSEIGIDCCNIARSVFIAKELKSSFVLGAVLLAFQYEARVLDLNKDKVQEQICHAKPSLIGQSSVVHSSALEAVDFRAASAATALPPK